MSEERLRLLFKCECESCGGTGEITCPECDGGGTYYGDIETFRLERNMHNYDELLELQKDAKRVIRQSQRLIEMKPDRTASYQAQLKATLSIINSQAERAAKRK
jgi:hypothetical protein